MQGSSSLNRSGYWFLRSGIQEAHGGVARYHHSDTGRNAPISTEITGYAVSCLVYLYVRSGDREFLDGARQAARFLTRKAWRADVATFPFEYPGEAETGKALTYFFDCGIIIRGLLALWNLTKEDELLDTAVRTGSSMAEDFLNGTEYHPILNLPDKSTLPYAPQWSRSPGCYQLKSALAWHDLYEATGNRQNLTSYKRALQYAMATHDTFLPAETPEKTMDRLHAYCYFLEGLLPALDQPECKATLTEGIQRVSDYLRAIAPLFERSDVYAQLLRLRLLAVELAGVRLKEDEATEEANRIPLFQWPDSNPKLSGGYCFGFKEGKVLPFANPVSTSFCLQALEMWADYRAGLPITRNHLI